MVDTPDALAAQSPGLRFVGSSETPDISVVIVNYNTTHLLERCVGSLRAACAGLKVQLVIVDNASRDAPAARLRQAHPDATVIANEHNVGFGRANNQALASCGAPFILLLNPDAYVLPDTLRESLAYMRLDPRCGVLGARLTDESGAGPELSGRPFPDPWSGFTLATGLFRRPTPPATPVAAARAGAYECDWVVGCYYLVRRETVARVGLFDPRYFLYVEEVDHCRAVRAGGWRVVCLTDVRVVHVGGASAETEGKLGSGRQLSRLQLESSLLYHRKHGGVPGMLRCFGLGALTELVLAAKCVLKGRLGQAWRVHARTLGFQCAQLWRTRWGTVPTR